MLHCMNIDFDGMAVAGFQQVVGDLFPLADTHSNVWNFTTLRALRGHIFGPFSPEMFAVYGEKRLRRGLLTLLTRSSHMQVSVGHDRLYALMHLAGDYEEGAIKVDYNKTEGQIMADAAAYYISQYHDLVFLNDSFRNDVKATDMLKTDNVTNPTWIPDSWMGGDPVGTAVSLEDDLELRRTKCVSNAVSIGSMTLRIRGVKVGWVQQCLTSSADTTINCFWASPLGEYLQLHLGHNGTGLPLEFPRAIEGGTYGRKHHHESIQVGLSYFLGISKTPGLASQELGYRGSGIQDLLAPLKRVSRRAWFALRDTLQSLYKRSYIITNSGYVGLVPDCNIREGDDIWIIIGSCYPVVVRPQPNGKYWHICVARIPALEGHEDIAHLVSESQPGDRVGEWMVEDIELQ